MLKFDAFKKKWMARTVAQIKTRPLAKLGEITAPQYTHLHYFTDSQTDYGIRSSNPFLIGFDKSIRIQHTTELVQTLGKPTQVRTSVPSMVKAFLKSRPKNFRKVTDLEKNLKDKSSITVTDYSLISHLYKYPVNRLSGYYKHANLFATVSENINQVGSRRNQFLNTPVPTKLPDFKRMIILEESKPGTYVKEMSDPDLLNILELFKIISAAAEGMASEINVKGLEHLTWVFNANGACMLLHMSDVMLWAMDNPTLLKRNIHERLEIMSSDMRHNETDNDDEVTDVGDPSLDTVDDIAENSIGAIGVKSKADALLASGRLTIAQRDRLVAKADSYKKIPDPHGGTGTLVDTMHIEATTLAVTPDGGKMPDKLFVVDKSMLSSSIDYMSKNYVRNLMKADIARGILHVQKGGVIVSDVRIERKRDALNVIDTYVVKLEPVDGVVSTVRLPIPVVTENGTFRVSGVEYRMDPQRVDLPIRKTGPESVALTSYISKVFLRRTPRASANYRLWLTKLVIVTSMDREDKRLTSLTPADTILPKVKLPRSYAALCPTILRFKASGRSYFFNYDARNEEFGAAQVSAAEKGGYVACGTHGKGLVVMDMDDNLYDYSGGKHVLVGPFSPNMMKDMPTPPVEYVEVGIFGKHIPLGPAMASIIGLEKLLKVKKIQHRWSDAGKRVDMTPSEFRIRFQDESLIVDSHDYNARLLIGGFLAIKKTTVLYPAGEFNKSPIYSLAFENINVGRYIGREFESMYSSWVDHLTEETLIEMGEPTTFEGLLYRSVDLMSDDQWSDEMDPTFMRTRGYERIAGFVINQFSKAMREQASNPMRSKVPVSFPPRQLLTDIVADQSVVLVEESNPVHALKEAEAVTFTGQGGRSPQTMVKSSRVFHDNDVGVISESTPDSSKVGIRSYRSPNALYTGMRGTTRRFKPETDGWASLLSSAALCSPGSTHNDPKRINLSDVQWSAMVSAAGGALMPVRTGGDMVVANRGGDEFAYPARADGVVVKVVDDAITILYDVTVRYQSGYRVLSGDVIYDGNALWRSVHTATPGQALVSELSKLPTLKSNEKVTGEGVIIIGPVNGVSTLLAGSGVLAMMAKSGAESLPAYAVTPTQVEEAIVKSTSKLASKGALYSKADTSGLSRSVELGTHHGKAGGSVIPQTMITDHKKGDRFKLGDILVWNVNYFSRDYLNPGGVSLRMGVPARVVFIELTDTFEDSSSISPGLSKDLSTPVSKERTILLRFDQVIDNLVAIGDEVTSSSILCTIEDAVTGDVAGDTHRLTDLTKLAASIPKAKAGGTVSAMSVVYMGDTKDMHPSLQRLVRADNKTRKRKKEIRGDADYPTSGEIKEYSFVGGQKVTSDTLALTMYIDTVLPSGVGDKNSFDTALKSIPASVMAGIHKTEEDGIPIDAYFSYRSASARIVCSPEIDGSTNTTLIQLGQVLPDMYFK